MLSFNILHTAHCIGNNVWLPPRRDGMGSTLFRVVFVIAELVAQLLPISLQLLSISLQVTKGRITRLTYNCAHLRSTNESLTFEHDIWYMMVYDGKWWYMSVEGGTGWYLVVMGQYGEVLLGIREGVNEKKTFSFGHCPNYLDPPHDPNSGNLVLFFRKSKFKIWKSV